MNQFIIRRPTIEDQKSVYELFKVVIKDTFKRNGIDDLVDMIDEEIKEKKKYFMTDINTNGNDRYFLIATLDERVVGTIEYGLAGKIINECTQGKLKEFYEIGTVFVHPEYQQKGIGSHLLTALLKELESKNISHFCLDSGYESAQKIWTKKFGQPKYHIKNYWGEDAHHMIWVVKISDILR